MSDHAQAHENQRKRESVVHPALDIKKMFQAPRDFFPAMMAAAKTGSEGHTTSSRRARDKVA